MKTTIRNTIFAGLFILSCSLHACNNQNDQDTRPNVLLIVADDMIYDSHGFAGGVAPDVTPNLDQLA